MSRLAQTAKSLGST